MDRSKDWATRLMHEASMHKANSFLTLTYADQYLPDDYSVSRREMQLFMMKIRKSHGTGVRFFACGEYGEANWRPHYHLAIFGLDWMGDRYLWRKSGGGYPLYRSPSLEKLWTKGHSEIGTLTLQSAGYIARYILKKVGGDGAAEHYRRLHPVTGEIVQCEPEFIQMSTRPGLGSPWYDKFSGDAFPSDFLIVDGQKRSVPRYYTKKLAKTAELAAVVIKGKRTQRAKKHARNNTPERLAVREELQQRKAELLKREDPT